MAAPLPTGEGMREGRLEEEGKIQRRVEKTIRGGGEKLLTKGKFEARQRVVMDGDV